MPAKKIALAALLLLASACGKQTFLAAAFFNTPAVPNPVSPSQPIPPQALVLAYLGTIDTSNPTKIDSSKIGTITGAKADITWHSLVKNADLDLAVKDRGDGSYSIDNNSNSNFIAEPGQGYTLVLVGGDGNDAYGAKLTPPAPAQIKQFHPTPSLSVTAGADVKLDRSDSPGSDGRYLPAFVAVMKVDTSNPSNISLNNLVYSTIPQDGPSILKFALSDANYRQASYTIPGSVLTKGNYYVAALLVINYGLVSENTFLGSTAMAGTGDAGLLVVN
jgi:hypothetical protein